MSITLPEKPIIKKREGNRAIIEIQSCWPGYGMTLGNALRRVLLSSLSGAAVTGVKIKGVSHEFSTLSGVLEDVLQIVLNLKQLRFKMHIDEPVKITLSVKGEKEIDASFIKTPSDVEIINKDCHIATLTDKKAELGMEIQVEKGMGYVPAEQQRKEKLEVGMIAVDAIFTPMRKVNYEVENMRVGDKTNYNKLIVDIETDGTITPEQAFRRAAEILVEHFKILDISLEKKDTAKKTVKSGIGIEDVKKTPIEELKISTRTLNALTNAGIKTVGGLAKKSKEDILAQEGMGEKGLKEIEKALGKIGLALK